MISVVPVIGERTVPIRIRVVTSIVVSYCVFNLLSPNKFENLIEINFDLAIFEIVVGLALGLTVRLFMLCLQIAAAIIAQTTSLSQIFGLATSDPLPAIGHLLVIGGTAIVTLIGYSEYVVSAFMISYDLAPPGTQIDRFAVSRWNISEVSLVTEIAFQIASPFVAVGLIYNIALGVINKAMPQLMVAFVGAPAITLGGLVLLMISVPYIFQVWVTEFVIFLSNPFRG